LKSSSKKFHFVTKSVLIYFLFTLIVVTISLVIKLKTVLFFVNLINNNLGSKSGISMNIRYLIKPHWGPISLFILSY